MAPIGSEYGITYVVEYVLQKAPESWNMDLGRCLLLLLLLL